MSRVKLDECYWNQDTFSGRLKYFFWVTDPRSCLASDKDLENAQSLLNMYRLGKEPDGTTEEQVWRARQLYESAYHPDTGDKMNLIGRMSFQVPGGMAITGCLLQFYKTIPQVVFWQWVNQSFNALVNYTNRNAKSPITNTQITVAYATATTSAVLTSIGFKRYLEKRATPLVMRYVPFAAVAAANCANIPLMRQRELADGVAVFNEKGENLGTSKVAAMKGIGQVIISRIVMAAPGMTVLPVIMEYLEKKVWMQRVTILHGPMQILGCGAFLLFMTPGACALFPQKCSINLSTLALLEPEAHKRIVHQCGSSGHPAVVYFNKGL